MQVLTANPDIHTLWNIRRECVHSLVSGQVSAQLLGGVQHNFPSIQARAGDGEAEGEAAWRREVELTAQCLITNPKSYGAWHHRCYSLDQMAEPDWDRELALCAKFLSMDERNFHCWDYRSIAAGRARRSAEAEAAFTLEMITTNFSNYSAWHYRSKLLGSAVND